MRRSRLRRAAGPEATITTAVRCAVAAGFEPKRYDGSGHQTPAACRPLAGADLGPGLGIAHSPFYASVLEADAKDIFALNPWNKVRFAGRTLGRCGNCYG